MKKEFSELLKSAMEYANMNQQDLIDKTGITSGAISSYLSGRYEPKQNNIFKLAKALGVSEAYLLGLSNTMATEQDRSKNIFSIPKTKIPLIGTIAAGEPILAVENIEEYLDLDEFVKADFALKVKGDSMIGAGIKNGDIVFIRIQNDVDDGEIAAVLVEDSATLKRVFKIGNIVQLRSENPSVEPITLNGDKETKILGKAISRLTKI